MIKRTGNKFNRQVLFSGIFSIKLHREALHQYVNINQHVYQSD